MLAGFIIVVHVIICMLLATLILVQSGKGGGLTEQFAPAGEMFGTQTSGFLIKGTTIFASLFLATCLSLALLSSKKEESLMAGKVAPLSAAKDKSVQQVSSDVKQAAENAQNTAQEAAKDLTEGVQAATDAAKTEVPSQPVNAK